MGFLSGYDGELREPLMWPQVSPVSIQVARGSAALLSSKAGESGLKTHLRGNLEVFLEVRQETLGSLAL